MQVPSAKSKYIYFNIDFPTDVLMVNQMQSMDFTGHQAMNQKTQKHTRKPQPQAPKIKQEPRSQPQLLFANQFPFHRGAAGRASPNGMMSEMSSSMNMNISSSPLWADSSVKAMMSEGMCAEGSSNANTMNRNIGSNSIAIDAGMAQNSSGIMYDINMTINQN